MDHLSTLRFSFGSIASYSSFGVFGLNMLTVKDADDTHEFYTTMSHLVDNAYMEMMAFSDTPIEDETTIHEIKEGDD